jgi:hypothetical protein
MKSRLPGRRLKPAKTGLPLSAVPFHLRATIALGMWFGLNEVAPKGAKAPRSLQRLTEQLIGEASKMPAEPIVHEARCRACGCTESRACEGGCYWLGPGLCSRCGERIKREKRDREDVEWLRAHERRQLARARAGR